MIATKTAKFDDDEFFWVFNLQILTLSAKYF